MPETSQVGKGSLTVVGTGIRIVGQLTMEAIACMRAADRLLYIVTDPLSEETIRHLNPEGAESLAVFYADGKPRIETYEEMVERTLTCVRSGMATCFAAYGHPGVFAYPTHEAIRRARAEGYPARMLPGVSAEDCLFADMGIDPSTSGCQSYEATDFLLCRRSIDTTAGLILWQIGLVCDPTYSVHGYDTSGLPLLVARLCRSYPPDHVVYIYEAPTYPGQEPSISALPLCALASSALRPMSTLYIPPSRLPTIDPEIARKIDALLTRRKPAATSSTIGKEPAEAARTSGRS
jgi:siroheme synthase